ncbi:CpXC domain-containing protein [Ktedonobacter robiniae]|uniref:CpXC domain-containing protein n=1 Tax=Ktedonobacter robiniae TaxID=2778365 RepID=UPI001916AFD1|nr:CpXC domain-containing protein [Ktedonobacter robiniae]
MSRSTTHTFTCPCGEVFSSSIYEYVNVAKDAGLRYTVLAGLLNVSVCPNCGLKAAISTPFIYSDPAHNLLAYVHPRGDAPQEARLLILENLRSAYENVEALLVARDRADGAGDHIATLSPRQAQDLPPLQVVFGLDQLSELISGVLAPEERLGKLALSTQSRNDAERGQFYSIARKLASEMDCSVEVESLPDEYVVWLYGSRRQIGALMRELAPGG